MDIHDPEVAAFWRRHSKVFAKARREPLAGHQRPQTAQQRPIARTLGAQAMPQDLLITEQTKAIRKLPASSPTSRRETAHGADSGLCVESLDPPRPYLRVAERKLLRSLLRGQWHDSKSSDWEGKLIHVDPSFAELLILASSVSQYSRPAKSSSDRGHRHGLESRQYSELIRQVVNHIRSVDPLHITKIVRHARSRDEYQVLRHKNCDLEAILWDALDGHLPCDPRVLRFTFTEKSRRRGGLPVIDPCRRLQLREIGGGHSQRGFSSAGRVIEDGKNDIYDSLRLQTSWVAGASSDVMSIAWSPNGHTFAAGCAATTDDINMQYNRRNNLLLGQTSSNTIYELPDHRLPRHRPTEGPNSTDEMFEAMDPWLYYTVSSVTFSAQGHLFSASYDGTVKIWDTTKAGTLLGTLEHERPVDLVAHSHRDHHAVATASTITRGSIRVYHAEEDDASLWKFDRFSSQKSLSCPEKGIFPSCLQWGRHQAVSHLLLAGFSPEAGLGDRRMPSEGDLCLWDVNSEQSFRLGSRNTLDCAWHARTMNFATGCVVDNQANRGIRTYVRLYGPKSGAFVVMWELECPALDINQVTWRSAPSVSYVCISFTDQ